MELRIVDKEGKELGKMVLNDEVFDILTLSNVDMMFDYKSGEEQVVAYIY